MSNAGRPVIVIGSKQDANAQYVAQAVARRGAEVLTLETAKVPESATLSWDCGELLFEGISLNHSRSFYLKALHLSVPSVDPGHFSSRNFEVWHEQYAAERERHSLLASVLRDLEAEERCFVNPVSSIDLHFLKLYQLSLLRRAGVSVPDSLGTCDPEAIQAFAGRYDSVIYKPLSGGAVVRRLQQEDLQPTRLGLLRHAPVLFQEEIKGEEFRVYVLDGEPVQAFQIPTEGVVDARAALDQATATDLPRETWELCIRAAEAAQLVFTAVDLRRTDEGREVVLECNPTPAISFFEDPVDGVIINRLADFLVERA